MSESLLEARELQADYRASPLLQGVDFGSSAARRSG